MSDSIVEPERETPCSPVDLPDKTQREDEEWSSMKAMITDQLDQVTANLDDLRKKGCLESIAFQIERGDRCPEARLISWYLAMLEVEFCSRKEVTKKLENMFQLHSSSKNKSFILDTNISRAGRPLDASDYRSIVKKLEGKTNLSIVERQDLWLAKKNIRNEEALTRKKEAEEIIRAQSAPNLERSRQSFKMSTDSRPKEPLRRTKSGLSSTSTADRRRPPAIPNSTRSLSNITNKALTRTAAAQEKTNVVEKVVKKKKKRQPISDPFATSSRRR